MVSPIQRVNSLVSADIGNYLTNVQTWKGIIFNVKDYGAKGDGTTDDTASINAAIDACSVGGVVFFPTPNSKYFLTSTLTINKPIKLMGPHQVYEVEDNLEKANVLEFSAAVNNCIHITSYDVSIEGLVIKSLSTSSTFIAGIFLDTANPGDMRNSEITDVIVFLSHIYGAGIKGKNVITSTFRNVICHQGAYGFYFDVTGTSILFDRTWALNNVTEGYYIEGYTYCTFLTTTCDSTNNPTYAYHIKNCKSFSFVSAAAEKIGKSMFLLENSEGIGIRDGFAVNMNLLGTAVATFAEITGTGSKYNSFMDCVDQTSPSTIANVRIDTADHPVIINSDFPIGFSDNGTLVSPITGRKGYIQIGRFSINEVGGAQVLLDGREVAVKANRLGVQDSTFTTWLGYFRADGGINIRDIVTLPSASVSLRGVIYRVQGGTGVSDHVYICQKDATDTYVWVQMDN